MGRRGKERRGEEGERGGGEEQLPAEAVSGVFLPPSPPRGQMPAGKLRPPSREWWGEP